MSSAPDWPALTVYLLDEAEADARRELARLRRSRSAHTARRAQYMTVALDQITHARRELGAHPAAARAMYHAMQAVGLTMVHALVVDQHERRRAATGGVIRGQQITREAGTDDHKITRAADQWRQSEDLQDEYGYRSPVPYVMHKTRFDRRKIQRALKRDKEHRTRQ